MPPCHPHSIPSTVLNRSPPHLWSSICWTTSFPGKTKLWKTVPHGYQWEQRLNFSPVKKRKESRKKIGLLHIQPPNVIVDEAMLAYCSITRTGSFNKVVISTLMWFTITVFPFFWNTVLTSVWHQFKNMSTRWY